MKTAMTGISTIKRPEIPNGWQLLAMSVIETAFADLGKIPYKSQPAVGALSQDDAAQWFADDGHEPWAQIAGLDPDEVKLAAQIMAAKMRARERWESKGLAYKRPLRRRRR